MLKYLDIVVIFLFVLFVSMLDFTNISVKQYIAGGILVAYVIYYAIRKAKTQTGKPFSRNYTRLK